MKENQLKFPNDVLNEKPTLNKEISNSCDHAKGVQNCHSQRANFKSSFIHTSHDIRCFHCCKFGHLAFCCPFKRKSSNGPKMKWIPKGTKVSNISHIKPQGSKYVLKPKNDHFKRNVHKDKRKTNFKRKSFDSHPSHWYHYINKGFTIKHPHKLKQIWVPKEELYANNGEPKVV